MKNYIRPSVEVSKFDVADIITVSGQAVAYTALETDAASLYQAYTAQTTLDNPNEAVVVFQW